ncbi:MAG TPA: helix-turn-helix transcriptional regulator [Polyangiaceae bacterium]|jgi:DNA-binding XRE family transcriptional regulator|nr:helix-turn-helix transcriptional regulator [Polyangiaceae bacterium]
MPFQIGTDFIPHLIRARVALQLSQRTMGERFGVSHRTAHRWEMGRSYPSLAQAHEMVRAVFPIDSGLAARLAEASGTTLDALGLRSAPAAAPAPPARSYPSVPLVVDSVIFAGVEASDGAVPRLVVRDILRAGFARTRALGLTLEEVDGVLSSAAPPAKTKK